MKAILQVLSLPSVSIRDLNYAVTVMGFTNTELSTERTECLVGLFWHEHDAEDCFAVWKERHKDSQAKRYEKVVAEDQNIHGVTLYEWQEIE